jgi:hypothetical protein
MRHLTLGRTVLAVALVLAAALSGPGCSSKCTYEQGELACSMKCVSKPDKCRCAPACPCWTKHR